jgi:hypothetical protein
MGPAVLLVLASALLGACREVEGEPTAAASTAVPDAPDGLEELIVAEVPSGLPRLPDHDLHPPAGEKRVEDVAAYSDDPQREREVLEGYGYRYGWERFWGHGTGPVTSVFVDQFEHRAGAGAYAEDLARNDAEIYEGWLSENPPDLPGGCRLLVVEDPPPDEDLTGPAAFGWCVHGVFSVSVTAVAGSVEEATDEVREVLDAQLELLPPG